MCFFYRSCHNGKGHADGEHNGSYSTVASRQALRQRRKHTHAHQRGQKHRRHQRDDKAHFMRNEILYEDKTH